VDSATFELGLKLGRWTGLESALLAGEEFLEFRVREKA